MSGQGRGLASLAGVLTEQLTPPQHEPTPVAENRVVETTTPPPAAQAPTLTETAVERPQETEPERDTPPTRTQQSSAPPKAAARPATGNRVRAVPSAPEEPAEEPEGSEGPRYLRFEPKTVRLTADQVDALQAMETRLRRAARGAGRRSADLPSWNMLARIGVDLVLREADRLSGVTEDEMRASVGLDPLNF